MLSCNDWFRVDVMQFFGIGEITQKGIRDKEYGNALFDFHDVTRQNNRTIFVLTVARSFALLFGGEVHNSITMSFHLPVQQFISALNATFVTTPRYFTSHLGLHDNVTGTHVIFLMS